VTLGQNVLNAGLDALLVFGAGPIPPLGLAGAAWATVAATAAGTILFFALFLRSGTRRTSGSATSVRPDRTGMVEIARVGAPVGFSWLLEMAVWTIFTIYAAGLGKTPLAAHNIVMNVVHFSFLPGVAISITASTLVGQQLGADRPDVAERYAWAAMRACLMWMGTMGIVMVVFRHPLAAAFSSDPEVRGTAARVFLWAAAFQLFDGAGIVSSGTLRGAGDTRYPAVVSIATAWLVFLPAIHLLGTTAGLGIDGAWLAADIHLFVMGGLMVARLRRGGWKRLRLVGPPTAAGMTVERT
jgi:MATE family multidrug resistance protein